MKIEDIVTRHKENISFNNCMLLEKESGYANGPERALLYAILFDAIQNIQMCPSILNHSSRHSREALRWLQKKDMDYIFSFDNICEALGIDPD